MTRQEFETLLVDKDDIKRDRESLTLGYSGLIWVFWNSVDFGYFGFFGLLLFCNILKFIRGLFLFPVLNFSFLLSEY